MPGIFNRGEIVAHALQLGGNPSLTTRANEFLNLFLDHLARTFDWDALVTETSFSNAGTIHTFALPSDYGRVLAVHIDAEQKPLIQIEDWPEAWRLIRYDNGNNVTSSSKPTHFAIEPATPLGYVWPIPKNAYTGKLLYYKIPAELTSDAQFPWFLHSLALVNAVTTWAEAYERETLQVIIDRATDEVLTRYGNTQSDRGRAGSQNVQLDQNIYGGWRYRET